METLTPWLRILVLDVQYTLYRVIFSYDLHPARQALYSHWIEEVVGVINAELHTLETQQNMIWSKRQSTVSLSVFSSGHKTESFSEKLQRVRFSGFRKFWWRINIFLRGFSPLFSFCPFCWRRLSNIRWKFCQIKITLLPFFQGALWGGLAFLSIFLVLLIIWWSWSDDCFPKNIKWDIWARFGIRSYSS